MCAGETPATLTHTCLTLDYSLAKGDKVGDPNWYSRRGRGQRGPRRRLKTTRWAGDVAQLGGCLLSRHEVLGSISTTT